MDKQYCPKKHIGPKSDELNAEKEFVFAESMIARDFIRPDHTQLLFANVTYLEAPHSFQVMLPYGKKDFSLYRTKDLNHYAERKLINSPALLALDQCHNELKSMYDKHYRHDNINIAPAITQLVAVKLSNGTYCRAVVTAITYNDNHVDLYQVKHIDTGCPYVVTRDRIHPFPARFLSVTPQSIPCRLPLTVIDDDQKKKNKSSNLVNGWPVKSMDKFVDFCKGKDLLVRLFHFNDMDEAYTVDLYDYKAKESLIETMLNDGLARRIRYDYNDYSWSNYQ